MDKNNMARGRNWGKYILSGLIGRVEYILNENRDLLSEVEKKEISEIQNKASNLIDNWDKGTEKVLGDK